MTYREYFLIVHILFFTVFSVVGLMYYFCIQPVYNYFQKATDTKIVGTIAAILLYMLSILLIIGEVFFDGMPNPDGLLIHEFITGVYCFVGFIAFVIFTVYRIYKFFKYLGGLHESIRQKRMGE